MSNDTTTTIDHSSPTLLNFPLNSISDTLAYLDSLANIVEQSFATPSDSIEIREKNLNNALKAHHSFLRENENANYTLDQIHQSTDILFKLTTYHTQLVDQKIKESELARQEETLRSNADKVIPFYPHEE